ncbi:MAG: hypothetical protein V1859_03600 [archaeon]
MSQIDNKVEWCLNKAKRELQKTNIDDNEMSMLKELCKKAIEQTKKIIYMPIV